MPYLRECGYPVVYARAAINPIESIQKAFNQILDSPVPQEISLRAFLAKALAATKEKESDVLFLDQFEELFDEQYDAVARQDFLNALGEVYADTSLNLKIVIAMREDALAELSILKQQIPEIFYNEYHLELMRADQARQAIVNPLERYNIHYEEGLVDEMLKDLGGENVDPPQLQIVCDRLYTERELQDKVITRAQYDRLGGAHAILAGYLDDVLNRYSAEDKVKLQAVLKEFITSSGRRAVPTIRTLTQHTGLSFAEVRRVLAELEKARLICELPPERHFELVHEYLIAQIASWTSEEERVQKRAQEMLDQGFTRLARLSYAALS